MVTVAVMLVMLIGFAALVLDLGKLFQARFELQNASDSAALAGAQRLDRTEAGIAAARDEAIAYAALHRAAEQDVAITAGDIEFGHWDAATGAFTSFGTDPAEPGAVNAISVASRRDSIEMVLAPVLGINASDVTAQAVAIAGGPDAECAFPMVVPDCSLDEALDDGSCDFCMIFQDNNSDNAGWTSFDANSVGGPTIKALIEDACIDSDGTVNIDPATGECGGACNRVDVTQEIKVQNGNLMNQGNNNFCPTIQTILTRGILGGPAQPFTVRVPVLRSSSDTCDAAQFSSFKDIAGFAAMEIYGAKCGNGDPGVFSPASPCPEPPSGKYIVAALRCDLDSVNGVAGGDFFGVDALHVRLVE